MEVKKKSGPGIVETLSAGFEQVNKIIWIMLLPIAMDFFLWKGPLLSVAPVIRKLLAFYGDVLPAQMDKAQVAASVATETMQNFEAMRPQLEALAGQFNLLSLLVANVAVVPTVGLARQSDPTWVIDLVQPAMIALLAIVFELIGVLLGVLYLGLLAQQVRDGRIDARRLLDRIWRNWLSVIGLVALMIGLVLLIGVPGGIVLGLTFLISAGFGSGLMAVFAAMLQIGLMLALVYFFFLTDAIVVSEVGPIRAALNSVKVVARNFWSAIGLIVLIFVITAGTQVIWNYLSDETWGIVAAIIGNAYIASGLAAASMMFYKTRMARLSEQESTETEKQGHGLMRRM